MTQTVTLPDGSIHNFPDEATPEMMTAALGINKPTSGQSYGDRQTAIFNKGMNQSGQAFNSLMADHTGDTDYSPLPDVMDIAGGVGNAFAAPITAAVSGATRPIAKAVGGPEAQKQMAAGDYSQADKLAQDVTNLGTAVLPMLPSEASPFMKDIGEDLRSPLPPPPPAPTISTPPPLWPAGTVPPGAIPAATIKGASQNAYNYAGKVGGVLAPQTFTNDVMDIIDNAKATPIAGKVLTSEQKALNSALGEYSPLRNQPLTLHDYEKFDKSLTAKESSAMDGFKSTNNSRIIGQVQDAIRDRLQALSPDDVIGGKEGFDALTQHAIPLWSTQAKMTDLENIINRASAMDNPVTAMRTGFRNLSLSPKMAQYPPEVQALIQGAAKNPSDLLGILGSRLNPITNSTLTGKAANLVTSKVFRGIRDSMQNAKADKILSAMTEPVRGSVEKFSTMPTPPTGPFPTVPKEHGNLYTSGAPNGPRGAVNQVKSNDMLSGITNSSPNFPEHGNLYYKKGGKVNIPSMKPSKNLAAQFLATASK